MQVRELTKRSTSTAMHQAMTQTAANQNAQDLQASKAAPSEPVQAQPNGDVQPAAGVFSYPAVEGVPEGARQQFKPEHAGAAEPGSEPGLTKRSLEAQEQLGAKKQRQ